MNEDVYEENEIPEGLIEVKDRLLRLLSETKLRPGESILVCVFLWDGTLRVDLEGVTGYRMNLHVEFFIKSLEDVEQAIHVVNKLGVDVYGLETERVPYNEWDLDLTDESLILERIRSVIKDIRAEISEQVTKQIPQEHQELLKEGFITLGGTVTLYALVEVSGRKYMIYHFPPLDDAELAAPVFCRVVKRTGGKVLGFGVLRFKKYVVENVEIKQYCRGQVGIVVTVRGSE